MSAGFLALPCMEAAGSWQQAANKDARLPLLWLMSAKYTCQGFNGGF
jgi:hypothetical protein